MLRVQCSRDILKQQQICSDLHTRHLYCMYGKGTIVLGNYFTYWKPFLQNVCVCTLFAATNKPNVSIFWKLLTDRPSQGGMLQTTTIRTTVIFILVAVRTWNLAHRDNLNHWTPLTRFPTLRHGWWRKYRLRNVVSYKTSKTIDNVQKKTIYSSCSQTVISVPLGVPEMLSSGTINPQAYGKFSFLCCSGWQN
jgi:hypothetical protein